MPKELTKKEFEKLFNYYFVPLVAFSKKRVGDHDAAKEIVHKVFIKVWEKRSDIDLSKSVKSYLYTSVNNLSLNYIRDNKRFVAEDKIPEITASQDWNYEDNFEETELQEKVNRALNLLPQKTKKVFILSRYHELKYKEIAEQLDISVKTVESHITKALKIMREQLKEYATKFYLWILSFF